MVIVVQSQFDFTNGAGEIDFSLDLTPVMPTVIGLFRIFFSAVPPPPPFFLLLSYSHSSWTSINSLLGDRDSHYRHFDHFALLDRQSVRSQRQALSGAPIHLLHALN
jgi:hypothetical protein